MRNTKEINLLLRQYQKEWFETIVFPWIQKGGACSEIMQKWTEKHYGKQTKYGFCQPFFTGLCDYPDQSKPLVMFVGQETKSWGDIENFDIEIDLVKSQRYVCEYTENNLVTKDKHKTSMVYPNSRLYDRYYYWEFLRSFSGVNIVWNELDKIHYLIKDKNIKLYCKDEVELNQKIGETEKTLLQLEIETIKPDLVVFLVGNSYKNSLEQSFEVTDVLSKEKAIVTIDNNGNYLWTYHPRTLAMIPSLRKKLIEKIKEISLII